MMAVTPPAASWDSGAPEVTGWCSCTCAFPAAPLLRFAGLLSSLPAFLLHVNGTQFMPMVRPISLDGKTFCWHSPGIEHLPYAANCLHTCSYTHYATHNACKRCEWVTEGFAPAAPGFGFRGGCLFLLPNVRYAVHYSFQKVQHLVPEYSSFPVPDNNCTRGLRNIVQA